MTERHHEPSAVPQRQVGNEERSGAVLIARCPTHGLHGERDACYVCGGPVEQVVMVPVFEHQAAVAERDAEIERLRLIQFSPTGDNHHNAALCPYCGEPLAKALAERDALAARVEGLEAERARIAVAVMHESQRDSDMLALVVEDLANCAAHDAAALAREREQQERLERALAKGEEWWCSYPHATAEEQVVALVDACAYWCSVSSTALEDRDAALAAARGDAQPERAELDGLARALNKSVDELAEALPEDERAAYRAARDSVIRARRSAEAIEGQHMLGSDVAAVRTDEEKGRSDG
jgi:hypothetical protein